ncbi:MAG: esterase family protein [candidate division Zixibacteria bacterium]|nr:esterase family protein [candidate division Zixibacteria bacterium]
MRIPTWVQMRMMFPALLWLALTVPVHAADGVSRVEYHRFASKIMQREMRYAVYLPAEYDVSTQKYPVLYYLHGLFGNERQWEEKGGKAALDRLIEEKKIAPVVLIVPDGGNSFYVNSIDGVSPYEDYFVGELVPAMESAFRIASGRKNRGITGLSMGGFGALTLAMHHPDLFASASAHSAVLIPVPLAELPERLRQSYQSQLFSAVFGNPVDEVYWKAHHPIDLVGTAKNLNTVAWYFDCGTEDRYGFHKGAERLHAVMQTAGIPHESSLFPGGHGWEYALTHLSDSLSFHHRQFQNAKK